VELADYEQIARDVDRGTYRPAVRVGNCAP
jgi:hypothetical protein